MKITYKEIASIVGRTEANIKYMKKNNPKIFEVVKAGCLLKKYKIDINSLVAF